MIARPIGNPALYGTTQTYPCGTRSVGKGANPHLIHSCGETRLEIALHIRAPKEIVNGLGVYGTVKHSTKGIFQRWIGYSSEEKTILSVLPTVKENENVIYLPASLDDDLGRKGRHE